MSRIRAPTRHNLAARAGRWSAAHRRGAILGWVAFVAVAIAIGQLVPSRHLLARSSGVGESGRASRLASVAFPERAQESVLIESRSQTVDAPAVRATVADTVMRLRRIPDVVGLSGPFDPRAVGQIAPDRHAALVEFGIRGPRGTSEHRVEPMLDAVSAVAAAHPGVRVGEYGTASAGRAATRSYHRDLVQAELLSVPLSLAILIAAFGALVAAVVPVLLGLSAAIATIGLVPIVSQITPVDPSINSIILLIGLAVGVDYSLFYLRREREERAAGRSQGAALEAAAATSGRAVLASGVTVIIAMAGMLFTGMPVFSSLGIGAMLVVAVALAASLTVLPAALSWLGDRVDRGRLPLISRRRGQGAGIWSPILDRVLRHPALATIVAGGLLVALAVPTLFLHTAVSTVTDDLPQTSPVRQTYDHIEAAFPGEQFPAKVVLAGADMHSPRARLALAGFERAAHAHPDLLRFPIQTSVSRDGRTAVLSVPIAGQGTDRQSTRAVVLLREQLVPALERDLPAAKVGVTGLTAASLDFNVLTESRAPIVFCFVLGLAFLLLLVTFRSVVIAAKAIVLNLLSVGAAYGLLVLVFQDGWGQRVLGFHSSGAIASWLPLFLFVILFGLSMDYHVFILTRVREAYDRGMDTAAAVEHGIKATAGTVTSAAAVMVAVFAVFGTLSGLSYKQIGVGLAAAVLIDATLVRAVLLPAAMRLVGEANWYLPRWLAWLPHVSHEAFDPGELERT